MRTWAALRGDCRSSTGAVCNGIVRESVDRDAPRFDLHGNDYHSNEPWLPHNAYYLLAAGET